MTDRPTVSVVLPCLNEAGALGLCIDKIRDTFEKNNIDGEIVISDNGSTDGSIEIAQSKNVNLCHQPKRGYGNAYLKGFSVANGKYFIMADADDTYDFALIPQFLQKLVDEKYDFVTGSRYLTGGMGQIPFLHRVFGNPLLTWILNTLFGTKYTDVYCGYRGFSREAYQIIEPVSQGMEFNLELAINAGLAKLKVAEIPIVLGERIGESKLNTFSDGWRSLRMMLLYSPNQLFLVPGLTLLILGMVAHLASISGLMEIDDNFANTLICLCATISSVVGVQVLSLWLHAKTYSWRCRFDGENNFLTDFYKLFTLETGLFAGISMTLIGLAIVFAAVLFQAKGQEQFVNSVQWLALAATLVISGISSCFTAMFISTMSITMPFETRTVSSKRSNRE